MSAEKEPGGPYDHESMLRARRSVIEVINTVIRSIERYPGGSARPREISNGEKDALIRSARLVLRDFEIRTSPTINDEAKFTTAMNSLGIQLAELINEESHFMNEIRFMRYFPRDPFDRSEFDESAFVQSHNDSIPRAVENLVDYIRRWIVAGPESRPFNVGEIRREIPDQKIAPIQFRVSSGRLEVRPQPAGLNIDNYDNAIHSQKALLESGEKLIEALRESNCDRRLLTVFQEAQDTLDLGQDTIKLGLLNVSCEAMCSAFYDELPRALWAMLFGQVRGVSMYIAQFPEWQKFSANAADVDFDALEIEKISAAALNVAEQLEEQPAAAAPEVPLTIRWLVGLVRDPAGATKKAAFAVLRTMENLISSVFHYGLDFLSQSADKTVKKLSTVASVAAVGLLVIALKGAVDLSPVASRIGDSAWLKTVAEALSRQLDALPKD